jgi:hypothetical protein
MAGSGVTVAVIEGPCIFVIGGKVTVKVDIGWGTGSDLDSRFLTHKQNHLIFIA